MTIQELDKATPERADQHPPGRGGDEGVLRRQPALAVHGPDEPAGRADAQAPPLGPRPGRPVARARRLRRPRRPPQPLRPHLPDRDAGRPEHRPDRLARDVRPDQQLRLHRDAVPQGQADRRLRRARARPATRPARTSSTKGGDVVLKAGQQFDDAPRRGAQEAEGPRRSRSARSSPTRSSTCPPTRRRSTSSRRPTRRSTTRATSSPSAIPSRYRDTFPEARAGQIDYMDVSPKQVVSRRDRADPVPRARRREPRADGLEHAAPGRAAARAGVADRRHRHGGARRARLRPGPRRPTRRRRHQRRPRERIRIETDAGELDEYKLLQVRPHQPGHLHQPAPDRRRRRSASSDGQPIADSSARPRTASSRSARTSSSRS